MTSNVQLAGALRPNEQVLRDEVLELFRTSDMFTPEALARPTAEDLTNGTALIAEAIRTYQGRLSEDDLPQLQNARILGQQLLDEVMGMGPLQRLLDDPEVEEIIINGIERVFSIRRGSKVHEDLIEFDGEGHLMRLLERALNTTGRYINSQTPLVDARLPDGSRLNAVIAPVSAYPLITIRKFLTRLRGLDYLVRGGVLSDDAADYLTLAIRGGANTLVCGGTGSGKTTFLNALGLQVNTIRERIITIEETNELQLAEVLQDAVALESKPPGPEGDGEITLRTLVKNALRMRPTRIVLGEVRGAEALDMLLAMNSGHGGSMCTIHANDPPGALQKLRSYAMMAGELPTDAINDMIASAVHVIIHLKQDLESGRRVIDSIYEVMNHVEHSGGGTQFLGHEMFVRKAGDLVWDGKPSAHSELLRQGFRDTDIASGHRPWLSAA